MDEDGLCRDILVVSVFLVCATYHRIEGKGPDQLVFGRDMIFPIEHIAHWNLIRQKKQMPIDKDDACKNETRMGHNYNIGDQVIIRNKAAFGYETPYKGLYNITHMWTNEKFTLCMGAITEGINI